MLLTFAYYHILSAINQSIAHSQLVAQNSFDQELVEDIIADLFSSNLLIACTDERTGLTDYKLTDRGQASLETYERENPALIIRRIGG